MAQDGGALPAPWRAWLAYALVLAATLTMALAALKPPNATASTPPATATVPPAAKHTRPPPASAPAAPALGVRAAALIEESTGQMLYGENADARLPIASATKLMTALVTLHHTRLSQMFADPLFYPAAEDSQITSCPASR